MVDCAAPVAKFCVNMNQLFPVHLRGRSAERPTGTQEFKEHLLTTVALNCSAACESLPQAVSRSRRQRTFGRTSGIVVMALLCMAMSHAFGELAGTATIFATPDGVNFDYTISLKNTGNTNIGTFWFGWTPPNMPTEYDFLPSQPLSSNQPPGWLVGPFAGSPGFSIEFYNSTGSLIAPGQTAKFYFTSPDSPATLQGSTFGFHDTTSFIYEGAPEVGTTVQVNPLFVAAPKPPAVQPFLPTPPEVISTTPANGDQNPYGVAFVTSQFKSGSGPLLPGDILVSNFNNGSNLQGTGTTIMSVDASSGTATTFFTVPNATLGGPGTGLSTGLATLREGFVIVGSVPSSDGSIATSGPGSLLVIDATGHLVSTITDPTINGPWDMTVVDRGKTALVFISNVFAGTVVRLGVLVGSTGVSVVSKTVIASGYQHRGDSAAFAVGPTGLVFDPVTGVLYVASTEDNAVYAISGAAAATRSVVKGRLVYSDQIHLHGPLGMIVAPNGDLVVANSDAINSDPNQPSELVEFTKSGEFVKELSVDPAQGGSFGLATALESDPEEAIFAAVDDNTASLIIYNLPP
jgi:hypothetical protein